MTAAASLDGRVAVITGGASGIGARTAERFVDAGARVVIADMQRERGAETARALGDAAIFVYAEVQREPDVAGAVATALERFGRLDCIFNNAGFGGALGPVDETPVEEFDLTFAVLVRGVFLGIKHAAPVLKKQGSGSVINTGSVAGLRAGYSPHAYAAAKAAVIQLTKSTALELAPHSVRVNCICPGYIATPLAANTVGRPDSEIDAVRPTMAAAQPIPRPGEPEDIAQAALWLASDASSFVTGQALVVDGGVELGRAWDEQPQFFRQARSIKVYRPPEE